jgi:hypothetical protein
VCGLRGNMFLSSVKMFAIVIMMDLFGGGGRDGASVDGRCACRGPPTTTIGWFQSAGQTFGGEVVCA